VKKTFLIAAALTSFMTGDVHAQDDLSILRSLPAKVQKTIVCISAERSAGASLPVGKNSYSVPAPPFTPQSACCSYQGESLSVCYGRRLCLIALVNAKI